MLGLGRALGETIAVSLLLPQVPEVTSTSSRTGAPRSRASSPSAPARRVHQVRPHGRRPGPLRHDAGHQHARLGRDLAQPLRRGGGAVSDRHRSPRPPPRADPGRTPPPPERRRRGVPRELTGDDLATHGGGAAQRLAMTWLVFTRLTAGVGWFGVPRRRLRAVPRYLRAGRRRPAGRLVGDRPGRGHGRRRDGAVVLLVPLRLADRLRRRQGHCRTSASSFFTNDQRGDRARPTGHRGRRRHAIVGSLEQVGLALVMARAAGGRHRGVPQRDPQPVCAGRCGSSSTP